MTREIPLTQGYVTLVSDHRYEELSQYKWHADRTGYGVRARRTTPVNAEGKKCIISMHRQIMNAPPGMDVDHANLDQLDNRDENLRLCTKSQNMANRRKKAGFSSRFKGVSWSKDNGKWLARMKVNRRIHHLGYFIDEVEAARAYNVAAIKHFKEFALLNEV